MNNNDDDDDADLAEPWTTQGLLNDPVINPEAAAAAATVPPVEQLDQEPSVGAEQPQQQQQQQQQQRKRPRSPAPVPTQAPTQAISASVPSNSSVSNKRSKKKSSHSIPDSAELALKLKDQDPSARNAALKSLLKLTSLPDLNYSLGDQPSNSGQHVLNALVDIVHNECLDYQTFQQQWKQQQELDETNANRKDSNEQFKHQEERQKGKVKRPKIVLSAQRAWMEPPTAERRAWMAHVQQHLAKPSQQQHTKPKLLQTVLIILRNLSFVASNVRLLRQTEGVWSILISCLYEQHYSLEVTTSHSDDPQSANGSTTYNVALHAIFTLLNMAQQPHLDVTGQLTVCDALFMDSSGSPSDTADASFQQPSPLHQLGWGGMLLAKRLDVKEDVVTDVSKEYIFELAFPHLAQVWTLFSALRHVIINPSSPRPLLLVALDFLKECVDQVGGVVTATATSSNLDSSDDLQTTTTDDDIPNMAAIMKEMPTDVIEKCIDCLWIPRLGPDALDYVNPVHTMVARVSALKLRMGNDATVDTDLRDRALDVLVPWVSLDETNLSAKLARQPCSKSSSNNNISSTTTPSARFYHSLVPILSTRVGRNEAPLLATELLKYMASTRDNDDGLMYIQDGILELASRDARVAQLAFTHLYKTRRSAKEDEDEDGDDADEQASNSGNDSEEEQEEGDS